MEELAQDALSESERLLMEEKADLETQVLQEQSRAIGEVKAALQQSRQATLQQVCGVPPQMPVSTMRPLMQCAGGCRCGCFARPAQATDATRT